MDKYSKTLKIIGLILGLGVTVVLFTLEAFVPGMEGVHWFGIYTFMPGWGIFFIGVLLDKKPALEPNENAKQSKPLSLGRRIFWSVVFLLLALPIIFNLINVFIG